MGTNTLDFKGKEQVEEKAVQWLAAIDRGLNDGERAELEQWLAASPLHGEILVKYAGYWDQMDVLSAVAKVLPLDPDNKTPVFNPRRPQTKDRSIAWGGWALGASVAASVLAAVFILAPEASETYYSAVYQTSIGDQKEVELPDGSQITLNTDTEIWVQYTASRREVKLVQGEAYFKVAKNAEAPFAAVVDDDVVIAVGTEFNIERHSNTGFELIVTEGRVKVSPHVSPHKVDSAVDILSGALMQQPNTEPDEPLYLGVGEQVIVSPENTKKVLTPGNEVVEADLAWQRGLLVFQGETLEQAIEEINRYIPLNLVIDDPSIKQIEVGGYFKAGDTQGLLYMLEHNFGIKSHQNGNQLLLSASAQ